MNAPVERSLVEVVAAASQAQMTTLIAFLDTVLAPERREISASAVQVETSTHESEIDYSDGVAELGSFPDGAGAQAGSAHPEGQVDPAPQLPPELDAVASSIDNLAASTRAKQHPDMLPYLSAIRQFIFVFPGNPLQITNNGKVDE
ncbi:hypothetical protein FRB90_010679, partial [Tulasnella sp. 427]